MNVWSAILWSVLGAWSAYWVWVVTISTIENRREDRARARRLQADAARDAARAAVERADAATVMSPALRAELDQTPQWWQREFDALVRARIPRDAASHMGHNIGEARAFDDVGEASYRWCNDCGVQITGASRG